jgi:hypothetical protein
LVVVGGDGVEGGGGNGIDGVPHGHGAVVNTYTCVVESGLRDRYLPRSQSSHRRSTGAPRTPAATHWIDGAPHGYVRPNNLFA